MPDLPRGLLYQSLWPYQRDYDNLPLKNIYNQINTVNLVVDLDNQILEQAQGNQGSLANRLARSLNDDGSLKTDQVDAAEHNIAMHEDGEDALGVAYVRMLADERAKLAEIADNSTALRIMFDSISSVVVLDNQTIQLQNTPTIYWEIDEPDPEHPEVAAALRAYTSFPATSVHQHFYGLTPIDNDPYGTPGQSFKVTSMSTAYLEDTLRVYVNGIRIFTDDYVYVPTRSGHTITWQPRTFTPAPASGTFEVSPPLSASDTIRIDLDIALT